MPSSIDLDINRAVRRILVKHWIDLGHLTVRSQGGRLTIMGTLQRISGRDDPLQPPTVDAMFRDMARIRGVRSVRAKLRNWSNEGGRWHPFERTAETMWQQDGEGDAV